MVLKKRGLIVTAGLAVGILCLASWLAMSKLESEIHSKINQSSKIVLDLTHQYILTWDREQRAVALSWAESPQVRLLVKELQKTQRTPRALINSPAQAELRSWLSEIVEARGYQGFFVIGMDNINLASMRDSNIGILSLLVRQKEFLGHIKSGETSMSLPQLSDVPLKDETGKLVEDRATMFVGAPIKDDNGKPIAILAFRIDPSEEFSDIFRRGKIGNTGETYAFNKSGHLISRSRFQKQLVEIGLLRDEDQSHLAVDLRDPGVNLVAGEYTSVPRQRQKLTRMAQSATGGESGDDIDGYRDYRGVPVVGSWLWDEELGFGMATEIDVSEAFLFLYLTRSVIIIFTSFSVIFLVVMVLVFTFSRSRLKKSEILNTSILRTSPDGILTVNRHGVIETLNLAAERIFGYSASELIGSNVNVLIPEQYRAGHEGLVSSYMDEKKPDVKVNGREVEGLCKDGTVVPLEVTLSEMQVDDARSFVAIVRDVTGRKHAQAQMVQSAKLATLGEMSTGVAHEINQPLNIIRMSTDTLNEMLDEGEVPSPDFLKTRLERIASQVARAASIIDRMRTFGRKPGGHDTAVSPKEAVLNAVSHLREQLRLDGIELELDVPETCRPVRGDPIELEQVVLNLLTNARDAVNDTIKTKMGGERPDCVTIKVEDDPSLSAVKVIVEDTGGGIPEDVLLKIFDPFLTTKEVGKGTGLGLSISHGIVSGMHGTIVASNSDDGAIFTVTLPVADEETEQAK